VNKDSMSAMLSLKVKVKGKIISMQTGTGP